MADRHARYFRAVAERAEVELRGSAQRETLRLLRDEQPNIRAAIAWLSRPGGDIDSALVTAGSLGMFWHLGRHLEGREVLGRLVGAGATARRRPGPGRCRRCRSSSDHGGAWCTRSRTARRPRRRAWPSSPSSTTPGTCRPVEGAGGGRGRDRGVPRALGRVPGRGRREFSREGDAWGRAVIGFVRLETAMKAGDVTTALRLGPATAASFRQLDDLWGLSATLTTSAGAAAVRQA